MYVIILEHPSHVIGNDVHTCVHLFRAFLLQTLVHICAFIHLFFQESSLSIKVCTPGKNVEAYYLMNFPADTLINFIYFCFMANYTDLKPKIPLYLCQETNLYCVASLPQGWGRGNIHLKRYLHLVDSTASRAYLKLP